MTYFFAEQLVRTASLITEIPVIYNDCVTAAVLPLRSRNVERIGEEVERYVTRSLLDL
jgi:hypothetical protein